MPLLRQAIWEDIWKHTEGKSETNAASVTLPALPQVLWGDIWRGTVQCRKEKREKSTFVIFSRCSERMCPLENLFFREKRYAGQTSTWWLMGKKYSTEKQFGLVCIILILFCSVILDVVQNSENEAESSGKELRNTKTEKSSWETEEGRVDKLDAHEWTNWRRS